MHGCARSPVDPARRRFTFVKARPEYPSAADAKWAIPFALGSLFAAYIAARIETGLMSVVFAAVSIGSMAPALWWATRRQRFDRMMGTTPAYEGTATLDRADDGTPSVVVSLRNGEAWRWRVDEETVAYPHLDEGIRVRVWNKRNNVVARVDEFTFWPVGRVRRVPERTEARGR
jgi:hypothetical protein